MRVRRGVGREEARGDVDAVHCDGGLFAREVEQPGAWGASAGQLDVGQRLVLACAGAAVEDEVAGLEVNGGEEEAPAERAPHDPVLVVEPALYA